MHPEKWKVATLQKPPGDANGFIHLKEGVHGFNAAFCSSPPFLWWFQLQRDGYTCSSFSTFGACHWKHDFAAEAIQIMGGNNQRKRVHNRMVSGFNAVARSLFCD